MGIHGNLTKGLPQLGGNWIRTDCRFKLTKATAVRQLVGVKSRFGYI